MNAISKLRQTKLRTVKNSDDLTVGSFVTYVHDNHARGIVIEILKDVKQTICTVMWSIVPDDDKLFFSALNDLHDALFDIKIVLPELPTLKFNLPKLF